MKIIDIANAITTLTYMDRKEVNDFVTCLYETNPKLALDIADKILVIQQDKEVA
jgi:hypothetical protein